MELKWLEDFIAVAETLSFSRAAESRHVTQSAFSRRIKQLENWMGTTLINRATVPAELTPAGQSLLPVAQDIIRSLYGARETLQPTADQSTIRLAALHTLTVTFFPDWLRLMEMRLSKLRTLIIPDRGGIEANLATLVDAEADFFLTYAHRDVPLHLDSRRFKSLTIGRDRLIPVCAPKLQINGTTVSSKAILDKITNKHLALPYLGYGLSSFFGVALQRLFATQPPFRRQTVHENMICAGLKKLAVTGTGLCWLPENLVRDELRSESLVFATEQQSWILDLKVMLYRTVENSNPRTDAFWATATTVAHPNQETPLY